MKEKIISLRNTMIGFLYKNILKKIFFALDPEDVHDHMSKMGERLGSNFLTRKLIALFFSYSDKSLAQDILGIHFKNPIGLAAGFDKDAQLTGILPSVGFGFEEIGSITGEACAGNPRPRLWRLKASKSLVVYYGLKNKGCEALAKKLKDKKSVFPIGVRMAKTNCAATADMTAGAEDYVKVYDVMKDVGDYVTINISCPNAFGGQPFSDKTSFEYLMKKIFERPKTKPIFIKMSPDLSQEELDNILDISAKYGVDGFICANLTKNRNNKNIKDAVPDRGGMSGKVVAELTDEMINYIYQKTSGRKVIIGCGGVFDAQDAYKKIKAGASLIQMITGMIFEGPQVISEINLGLKELLKRDGFKSIADAVGRDARA